MEVRNKIRNLLVELDSFLFQMQVEDNAVCALFEEFLSSVPGVILVKKEHRESGVLIAGAMDVDSSLEVKLAIGVKKNLIAFRFLSGNRADLHDSWSNCHAPIISGSWSDILVKIIKESIRTTGCKNLVNIKKAAMAVIEEINKEGC